MSKPAVTREMTLHVRDACLCLHVQRAARSLARLFDDAFRPMGITNGQFSLMMALYRPQPARMRELSAFLAMDRRLSPSIAWPLGLRLRNPAQKCREPSITPAAAVGPTN